MFLVLDLLSFLLCSGTGLICYIDLIKLDYLSNRKAEISNACNVVEGNCLQVIKVVHHNANSCLID